MIYKINIPVKIIVIFLIFSLCTAIDVSAQSNVVNKYGLNVVNDIKLLQKESDADSNKQMVNLLRSIQGITLDLRYATTRNFMHQKIYPSLHTTYLRLPAAKALKKIVAELKNENLSVKIFDAYRPYSVTEKMWEIVKDNRYAADPAKGSGHNRGVALDLTLIDLHTKKELPMGTGFDNFSDSAHTDFIELPDSVLQNRRLLKTVMEKYGFKSLDTEWWHFSLPGANAYELLDVPFDDLKKLTKKLGAD
jgi:D-alanyl-D-alanine dipeptidase